MKKIWIFGISCLLVVLIGVFLYNVNQFNQEQKKIGEEYVLFSEFPDSIKVRLEKNGIPYKINQDSHVMIQRKNEEKAVVCCT